MFHRFVPFLAAAATAMAGPAAALSCLVPEPTQAFADANAAPETYIVVVGTFSGGAGPRPNGSVDGIERSYHAQFSGHVMSRHGLKSPLNRQVRVQEVCLASWCGELQTGVEVLTFLRMEPNGGATIEVGPCQGNLFPNPTRIQKQAVQSCFVHGCTAS